MAVHCYACGETLDLAPLTVMGGQCATRCPGCDLVQIRATPAPPAPRRRIRVTLTGLDADDRETTEQVSVRQTG